MTYVSFFNTSYHQIPEQEDMARPRQQSIEKNRYLALANERFKTSARLIDKLSDYIKHREEKIDIINKKIKKCTNSMEENTLALQKKNYQEEIEGINNRLISYARRFNQLAIDIETLKHNG